MAKEQNKLEDFTWEFSPIEEDSFTGEPTKSLLPSDDTKDTKDTEEKFAETINEKEEKAIENFNDGNQEKDDTFKLLATDLKNKGILSFEADFEELDEDGFFELQNKEVEKRVEETFEEFFQELDDDATEFLKFKQKGGDTSTFFNYLLNKTSVNNIDLSSETKQEEFIFNTLIKTEKLSKEEALERVEFYKERGKLQSFAEKTRDKIQQDIEIQKEVLIEKQNKEVEEKKIKYDNLLKETTERLSKTKDIEGFSIKESEKKDLISFILKPTIKTESNTYTTGLQKSISELFKPENSDKLILMAKFLKSGFKNIIDSKIKTDAVKEVRSLIGSQKSNNRMSSGNSKHTSIADFFS